MEPTVAGKPLVIDGIRLHPLGATPIGGSPVGTGKGIAAS